MLQALQIRRTFALMLLKDIQANNVDEADARKNLKEATEALACAETSSEARDTASAEYDALLTNKPPSSRALENQVSEGQIWYVVMVSLSLYGMICLVKSGENMRGMIAGTVSVLMLLASEVRKWTAVRYERLKDHMAKEAEFEQHHKKLFEKVAQTESEYKRAIEATLVRLNGENDLFFAVKSKAEEVEESVEL